jgi:hypothetical protein
MTSFTTGYASITIALPRSCPQCDRCWCIAIGHQRRVEAACIWILSKRYSHAVQGPVLPSLRPCRKHAPRLQPLAEERCPQLLVQNPAENTQHMSVLPGVLCLFPFFHLQSHHVLTTLETSLTASWTPASISAPKSVKRKPEALRTVTARKAKFSVLEKASKMTPVIGLPRMPKMALKMALNNRDVQSRAQGSTVVNNSRCIQYSNVYYSCYHV